MFNYLPETHLIKILIKEHDKIFSQINQLSVLSKNLSGLNNKNYEIILKRINHLTIKLISIKSHHQREEDIFFPSMIKHGASLPTTEMLKEHKLIRDLKFELKQQTEHLYRYHPNTILKVQKTANELCSVICIHIHHEHTSIFPKALELIKDNREWKKMKVQSDKIGYALFKTKLNKPITDLMMVL